MCKDMITLGNIFISIIIKGYFVELDVDILVSISYEKSTGVLICTVDSIEKYRETLEFDFVITD